MDDRIDVIALIAERKIAEAMSEGRFDNLPGAGRPLPEDDLDLLPAESRLAYRILRNSGYAAESAPGASIPPDPSLPIGSAEGRLSRRLTRLQLGLERRQKSPARQKKTPWEPAAETAEPPGGESSILDSPYLAKILDKIGGRGPTCG
jgi:hypothetical protein